jgi:hypothetical protein
MGPKTDLDCYNYAEGQSRGGPKARGYLSYEPTEGVDMTQEMSFLLTAGRLSDPEVLQYIRDMGQDAADDSGAKRVIQQLIASSPEFHATAAVKREGARPGRTRADTSGSKPYKAIVYFLQKGGMDTYNLIVPDADQCPDMYNMYAEIRGKAALTAEELGAPVSAGGTQAGASGCDSFRFHKDASFMESLYREGEAALLANTGVLHSPVTLDNWKAAHRRTMLFAHNSQQREIKIMDPFHEVAGTGVLGRMSDVLTSLNNGFQTAAFSIESTA